MLPPKLVLLKIPRRLISTFRQALPPICWRNCASLLLRHCSAPEPFWSARPDRGPHRTPRQTAGFLVV